MAQNLAAGCLQVIATKCPFHEVVCFNHSSTNLRANVNNTGTSL